jgi:hypothetical protein
MPENIDLSAMEDSDIMTLAARCLDALSLAQRVEATLKAFHTKEEREELTSWLEEDILEEDED